MQDISEKNTPKRTEIARLERIVERFLRMHAPSVTFLGEEIDHEEAASADAGLPLIYTVAERWGESLGLGNLLGSLKVERSEDSLFGSRLIRDAESSNPTDESVLLLLMNHAIHCAIELSPEQTLELKSLTQPQMPRVFDAVEARRWPAVHPASQPERLLTR